MTDRRHDPEARDRIDLLEAHNRRIARNLYAGGICVCLGVLVCAFGFYIGFQRIQASREEAAYRQCIGELRGNAGIHRFVLARAKPGETSRLERELQRDFPTIPELVLQGVDADKAADKACRHRAIVRTAVTP